MALAGLQRDGGAADVDVGVQAHAAAARVAARERAADVVYLTGPGDDDLVMAVAPVAVVKAGLAALSRTEDGDNA